VRADVPVVAWTRVEVAQETMNPATLELNVSLSVDRRGGILTEAGSNLGDAFLTAVSGRYRLSSTTRPGGSCSSSSAGSQVQPAPRSEPRRPASTSWMSLRVSSLGCRLHFALVTPYRERRGGATLLEDDQPASDEWAASGNRRDSKEQLLAAETAELVDVPSGG